MSIMNQLEEYLTRLEKDPQNPALLYQIGLSLYRLEDFDTANQFFKKAKVLDPKNESVVQKIGDCFFQLKQYDQALEKYQSLIR